jgi:hypothetical protein
LIQDGIIFDSIVTQDRARSEFFSRLLELADREACLIAFYFGRDEDYFSLCHKRAYRDLQRTLNGIGKPEMREARPRANAALSRMFVEIKSMASATQADFDDWHRAACKELKATYAAFGYKSFYVGHAQKWLNMTFKYIYVMGGKRISGFGHLYDLCHVPLDNILLAAIQKHGFQPLDCSWSRLDDYEAYLERQRWSLLSSNLRRLMSSFTYGLVNRCHNEAVIDRFFAFRTIGSRGSGDLLLFDRFDD